MTANVVEEIAAHAAIRPVPGCAHDVDNASILIVDDDASAATLMSRRLERDGFRRVLTIGDGKRALDSMVEHPPEVLVLDVHMPHFDGFHVLREIREGLPGSGADIGVLAVSGDHSAATCKGMLCAGADDFIFRPFDGTEFALRVRRLALQTRHLRSTRGYVFMLESRLRDLEALG
jgi:DNA-binding response OmpR family regulator